MAGRNLPATLLEMRRRHSIQPLLHQAADRMSVARDARIQDICLRSFYAFDRAHCGRFCARAFRYTLPTDPFSAANGWPDVPAIEIRDAKPADSAVIYRFIQELAEYEHAADEVVTTEAEIKATLFNDEAAAHAVICSADGVDVGLALYFFNYSTWLGKYGIYLEDLFVLPEHRGIGAGQALLKHLAGIAIARDCGRLEWSVLKWNEPAIRFYQAVGARAQDEWVGYRLTGQALKDFADS